ncbi:MAG: HD-GYP domain-containing protein [Spirochaetaceae bacterium]|jgi:putative nucleotidyltransferase with HDIG domain|nr:HD-GYP domain-containing protein [Spirochaetaceae bacterium]
MFGVVDFHEIIGCITSALEERDYYTEGHSQRVSDMVLALAKRMGFSKDEVMLFHFSAHLHDIGKIGIPDAILRKNGRLTDAEFAVIKQHPEIGARILRKSPAFAEIAEIVLHHHERFDGLGYPDGISGYNIPLGSRLIAVCDSIDAMMTTRSYRKAFSEQDCYEEIKRCSGTRYDPDVVDAVMTHWKELMKVAGYNL